MPWHLIVKGALRPDISEILIKIQKCSVKKMQMKMFMKNADHFAQALVC